MAAKTASESGDTTGDLLGFLGHRELNSTLVYLHPQSTRGSEARLNWPLASPNEHYLGTHSALYMCFPYNMHSKQVSENVGVAHTCLNLRCQHRHTTLACFEHTLLACFSTAHDVAIPQPRQEPK